MEPAATERRYLDNAATSWPKPPEVWAAWEHAGRSIGAAAGRAAYREALAADAIRDRCRRAAARLLGGADPARVALCSGATLALNMAIHGLLEPGDHVIATAADHNATLRPLHWLAARGRIGLTIVPCDGRGVVDPGSIAAAWRPATRLVTCSHASNVTGAVQDTTGIATIAHDRGGLFLLDAAQSLGQIPGTDLTRHADIVVAPAHKWLLGPTGAAMLWGRAGVDLVPLVQGGTGSASDSLDMPASFVDGLEVGTPDVPALAGFAAALEWLEARSIATVGRACGVLAADLAAGLAAVDGVRVVAAALHASRDHGEAAAVAPIVSFTVEGYDPAEVAALLEQLAGVQVRSGFHCAAAIHDCVGTRRGGTVRASVGPFNTAADIEALVAAVGRLAGT
ncbi:MAG: putative cysteine desulfurase [Planctomycetota bacterium]|jgi:selenocysteine lyase/cysteine desulfurase